MERRSCKKNEVLFSRVQYTAVRTTHTAPHAYVAWTAVAGWVSAPSADRSAKQRRVHSPAARRAGRRDGVPGGQVDESHTGHREGERPVLGDHFRALEDDRGRERRGREERRQPLAPQLKHRRPAHAGVAVHEGGAVVHDAPDARLEHAPADHRDEIGRHGEHRPPVATGRQRAREHRHEDAQAHHQREDDRPDRPLGVQRWRQARHRGGCLFAASCPSLLLATPKRTTRVSQSLTVCARPCNVYKRQVGMH